MNVLYKIYIPALLVCVSLLRAEIPEAEAPAIPANESPYGIRENNLDLWHARLSAVIAGPFDRIDRFFGDDVMVDESRRTRLRTGFGIRYDVEDGAKMVTDFSLRMALPRLEERWQIFLDELDAEDDLSELSDLTRPPVDKEPDVGMRYFLRRTLRTSLSADAGLRMGGNNQVFVRSRGRIRSPVGSALLELSQGVTYFSYDGWRSQSDIVWTQPLGNVYSVRSFSRVTVEDKSPGFAPEQRFSLFRKLTVRRGWRFEVDGIWPEMPEPQGIRYSATFNYRQLVHRDWLFVEVAPGLEFPQERDYAINPFITFKVEIVFNQH